MCRHASLVPETCQTDLLNSSELINQFLESRKTGPVPTVTALPQVPHFAGSSPSI